jgi:hypothetical protein
VVKDGLGEFFYSSLFLIFAPSTSSATRHQPGLDPTSQKEEPEPDLMVFD